MKTLLLYPFSRKLLPVWYFACMLYPSVSTAQQAMQESDIATDQHNTQTHKIGRANNYNYYSFTASDQVDITEELLLLTPKEYHDHPEFGRLPYNAPCTNCYELLQERKDSSRMFVKKGTNGTHFYTQGIYGTFHYQVDGWQMSYDPRLIPLSDNVYKTKRLLVPTILDVNNKYSSFEFNNKQFKFNRHIALNLIKKDGSIQGLGEANWSNHTVGNEGIYITKAWDGIDITISYQREQVKLNYIITQPLSYITDVAELRFIDHIELPEEWNIVAEKPERNNDELGYIGKYLIQDETSASLFTINPALGYDNNPDDRRALAFHYHLGNDNILGLSVPQWYLADENRIYPVVIDPLVTTTATFTDGAMSFLYGGDYCGGSGACNYSLSVPKIQQ